MSNYYDKVPGELKILFWIFLFTVIMAQLLDRPTRFDEVIDELEEMAIDTACVDTIPEQDNRFQQHDTTTAEPLIIAKLPRPVKMRNDMTMIFKIRLDM